MDLINDEQVLAILGRSDFVGGIDNEALDFSQLEAFINSDAVLSAGNTVHGYFNDTPLVVNGGGGGGGGGGDAKKLDPATSLLCGALISATTGTIGTTIGTIGTTAPLRLPESPPDSGSEHPYSPVGPAPPAPPDRHLSHHQQQVTTVVPPSSAPPVPSVVPSGTTIVTQYAIAVDETTAGLIYPNGQNETIVYADLQPSVQQTILPVSKKRKLSHCTSTGGNNGGVKLEPLGTGGSPPPPSAPPGTTGHHHGLHLGHHQDADAYATVAERYSALTPSLADPDSCTSNGTTGTSTGTSTTTGFQCIRFQPHQPEDWCVLCDQSLRELPAPHYRVDADKGFNFSASDDAFVCQKKNHFQITCHAQLQGDAQFVKTPEGLKKITAFHLHFYGVKIESPAQRIKVEQSQSDRSKKPFHPVLFSRSVDLALGQASKVTVGRLHFSETTSNNMRKKGKPNPDQRYFALVVALHAHTDCTGHYPVVQHGSERIIVRASNPGQFESDVELCWQRGQTQDSIFHAGKVGINTDRPDETLVVHGNVKVSGHIVQPSDVRAKQNISELDTAQQLKNVQQIRVVSYSYHPEFAVHSGLDGETDTGVIAQEVQQVIPDAVTKAGDILLPSGHVIDDFLVVNKDRIYMESIGAVKELCKVTDSLETRIDQLERVNRSLNKIQMLKRNDSTNSNASVTSRHRGCSSCQQLSRHNVKLPRHSNKCSKNNPTSDEEICSNKLIQVVIVILILIMASCLAAISTLYFLEHSNKYQQIYDSYNIHGNLMLSSVSHGTTESSFHRKIKSNPNRLAGYSSDISNFIDVIKTTLLNQMQTTKPVKSPYVVKSSGYDHLQNIAGISGVDLDGTLFREQVQHLTPSQMEQQFVYSRVLTVAPLDVPRHCIELSDYGESNCQAFCCGPRQPVFESPEVSDNSNLKKSIDYNTKLNTSYSIEVINEAKNLVQKHNTNFSIEVINEPKKHNSSYSIEIINDAKNLLPKHNASLYSNENPAKISKQIASNNVKSSARDKRQIRHVPILEELDNCDSVSVLMSSNSFNATLGTERVCQHNIKMLNITYNIPLSRFSSEPEFVLTFRSHQFKQFYLCSRHDIKNKDCSLLNQNVPVQSRALPRAIQPDGQTSFPVEMTGYQARNLTYRAPITGPDNMDICMLAHNFGGEFLEYNMNLYRDCRD